MSLLPFVPGLALRLTDEAHARPDNSRVAELQASVLLADLSGFTGLVDDLAVKYGGRGAERLQEILGRCFGLLTDIVDAAGGEVLCFPGDAALAVWTAEPGATALSDLVHQSALCGLELRSRLDHFLIPEEVELRLRVAVSAGPAWAALVGGVEGKYETVLQGAAVSQLAGALHAAQPGDVVIAEAARRLAGGAITTVPREGHFVLTSVQPRAAQPHGSQPAPNVQPDVIRSLVPLPVLSRIDAGLHGWLAEFRQATIVFAQILGRGSDDPAVLHRTMQLAQTLVAKFGGHVNQTVADDKGLTIVIAFGAVSRAHEDDAVRAVRTALQLREALRAEGVDATFGLATGRVFVGGRGGASRYELALMGASVVLAARLASVATDILCDAGARAASRRVIRFGSAQHLTLKGKASPIAAWRPQGVKTEEKDAGLVGRSAERAVLEERLTALEREGRAAVVVLEGEPGIGKTALLTHIVNAARSRPTRILTGAGDSIERRTAYLAWRSVATSLLGPDNASDVRALRARLVELLGHDNAPWLPLLNPFFAAPQPETEQTLSMNAESRAQTTRELMLNLLQSAARSAPLLVVLEDAHWMDSASWELTEQAIARVPRLLLLVSVRPSVHDSERLERLRQRPDTTTLRLEALSPDHIRELVSRRLDADDIPEALDTFIQQRAEGHPFFAQELSVALRDTGAIRVRDGICQLTGGVTDLATQSLPDTVQGIVATRIDQLTPQQQLTLKVAAILGRQFVLSDLSMVHPLAVSADLREHLRGISETGLLIPMPEREDGFTFSHALVQEVAYELVPFAQRRELHQRAAAWLEQQTSRSPDELTPLLAHHWERAEVVVKAMHYLEKAGERALMRDSSNREAEEFLSRLIAIADRASRRETVDPADRPAGRRASQVSLARWERMLSQAIARQGRHAPAMQHLERSIALLGHRVPAATLAGRMEFLRGIVWRLIWRPERTARRSRSDTEQLALTELTRAYDNFVQLLYLGVPAGGANVVTKGDVFFLSGVAVLRALKAAEHAGPSPELSQTYSLFANLVAFFRRQNLAAYYAAQGRAVAEEVGDRHALFSALTLGQLPAFIRGGWDEAAAALEQGVMLGAELRRLHDCLIYEQVLANISLNRGQLQDALRRFRDIRARAERDGHVVPLLWSTVSIGEVAFRENRLSEAIAAAEDCLALASRTNTVDQNSRFQAHGLLASAWLRKDDPERARGHLDPAMAAAESGARLSYSPQFGFVGVAEVLFSLWDRGGDQAVPAMARLRRWLRVLRLMAFCRPILSPWDLLFRAQWHARRGRQALALRRARQAIEAADRLGLAHESARARAEFDRLRSSRLRLESTHPG